MHRDLKVGSWQTMLVNSFELARGIALPVQPSNIFFSFDGRIKIGDFGLVAGDFDGFPSSRHTLLG